MPNLAPPDPVTLVAGPIPEPEAYRCPNCRNIASYPAAGVPCHLCSTNISSSDVVVYATIGTRLLALLLDSIVVGVPTILLFLWAGLVSALFAPTDDSGRLTHTAAVWLTVSFGVVAAAILCGYLLIGNAGGRTVGKHATGLRVVLRRTGDTPGFLMSLARTFAQLLTIFTLGLGFAIAVFDEQRRTLHDRIAQTIVVER